MARLQNFINGAYVDVPDDRPTVPVTNPADGSVIGQVPQSTKEDVDEAVKIAAAAQAKWGAQTYKARVQCLFKLKALMEERQDEIVQIIKEEHGKNVAEGKASLLKGIETLEWATSLPQMAAGRYLEVSQGISCREVRDPLGVVAAIVPFNFPVMVPFWTVPIAIGCGNAVVLKPSEKVPLTMTFLAKLFKQAGVPDGIFQIVHGVKPTVDALIEHPTVKAVSFVGTSRVAKLVADKARVLNKRALCLGGAKNHLCVLPDANYDMCTTDIMNSFAGSTGQRCMAASVCVMVGPEEKFKLFMDLLVKKASALQAGQEPGQVGPVIDQASKDKILRYINEAESRDGAQVLVDGRGWAAARPKGFWVGPTILWHGSPQDAACREEIFGPVLSMLRVDTFDEAIAIENSNPYGNAACIYTSVGQHSEYFLNRFSAAMLGVNIGVPVPREPFSFGGMNDSSFATSDITGDGAMEFFTQRKKITQKWVPPQDQSVITSSFIS
jgi:methylmalonic acid semialdehyde dehydrogenase